jgi:hypothetical protein
MPFTQSQTREKCRSHATISVGLTHGSLETSLTFSGFDIQQTVRANALLHAGADVSVSVKQ